MSGAFPPQHPGVRPQRGAGDGRRHHPHRVRPARSRTGARHLATGGRLAARPLPAGGGVDGRSAGRRAGLPRLPARALAPDLVEQPHRAREQGDQAPLERGGDLPQPGRGAASDRRDPGRAARRVAGLPQVLQRRVAGQSDQAAGGARAAQPAAPGRELSHPAAPRRAAILITILLPRNAVPQFPHLTGLILSTEARAGLTTFLVMAYIIFVNPAILSFSAAPSLQPLGLPFPQVAAVTALLAGLLTIGMGLYANYPFALAAGLGLNAVAAFQLHLG